MKQQLLYSDPDFILLKKFNCSLTAAIKRYPDGMRDELIAQALGISVKEVVNRYYDVIKKLRKDLCE